MPDNLEWVPIALFAAIATVLSLWLYFRYRARSEYQHTIRAAIDKGQELSPELLAQLGAPAASGNSDMRRGIISIAIGIGLAAFGILVGEQDAVRPLLAIGALPAIVGVAYLGLWKFGGTRN